MISKEKGMNKRKEIDEKDYKSIASKMIEDIKDEIVDMLKLKLSYALQAYHQPNSQ